MMLQFLSILSMLFFTGRAPTSAPYCGRSGYSGCKYEPSLNLTRGLLTCCGDGETCKIDSASVYAYTGDPVWCTNMQECNSNDADWYGDIISCSSNPMETCMQAIKEYPGYDAVCTDCQIGSPCVKPNAWDCCYVSNNVYSVHCAANGLIDDVHTCTYACNRTIMGQTNTCRDFEVGNGCLFPDEVKCLPVANMQVTDYPYDGPFWVLKNLKVTCGTNGFISETEKCSYDCLEDADTGEGRCFEGCNTGVWCPYSGTTPWCCSGSIKSTCNDHVLTVEGACPLFYTCSTSSGSATCNYRNPCSMSPYGYKDGVGSEDEISFTIAMLRGYRDKLLERKGGRIVVKMYYWISKYVVVPVVESNYYIKMFYSYMVRSFIRVCMLFIND